jgi:hypothetical protein
MKRGKFLNILCRCMYHVNCAILDAGYYPNMHLSLLSSFILCGEVGSVNFYLDGQYLSDPFWPPCRVTSIIIIRQQHNSTEFKHNTKFVLEYLKAAHVHNIVLLLAPVISVRLNIC